MTEPQRFTWRLRERMHEQGIHQITGYSGNWPSTTSTFAGHFVPDGARNSRSPTIRGDTPGHRPGATPHNPPTAPRPQNRVTGTRVAAMLLVLLGQPFSKIAALKTTDLITEPDGNRARIRLGQDLTTIPEPFAAMFVEFVTRRPHLTTAANPTSPWLFPGRRADNHLTEATLLLVVIRMGIDLVGGPKRSPTPTRTGLPSLSGCQHARIEIPSNRTSRSARGLPMGLLRRHPIQKPGVELTHGSTPRHDHHLWATQDDYPCSTQPIHPTECRPVSVIGGGVGDVQARGQRGR